MSKSTVWQATLFLRVCATIVEFLGIIYLRFWPGDRFGPARSGDVIHLGIQLWDEGEIRLTGREKFHGGKLGSAH